MKEVKAHLPDNVREHMSESLLPLFFAGKAADRVTPERTAKILKRTAAEMDDAGVLDNGQQDIVWTSFLSRDTEGQALLPETMRKNLGSRRKLKDRSVVAWEDADEYQGLNLPPSEANFILQDFLESPEMFTAFFFWCLQERAAEESDEQWELAEFNDMDRERVRVFWMALREKYQNPKKLRIWKNWSEANVTVRLQSLGFSLLEDLDEFFETWAKDGSLRHSLFDTHVKNHQIALHTRRGSFDSIAAPQCPVREGQGNADCCGRMEIVKNGKRTRVFHCTV